MITIVIDSEQLKTATSGDIGEAEEYLTFDACITTLHKRIFIFMHSFTEPNDHINIVTLTY